MNASIPLNHVLKQTLQNSKDACHTLSTVFQTFDHLANPQTTAKTQSISKDVFKSYARLIQKIRITSLKKIDLMTEFLMKTSEERFYHAHISRCDFEFFAHKNKLNEKFKLLTEKLQDPKMALSDQAKGLILEHLQLSLQSVAVTEKCLKNTLHIIHSYVERVNAGYMSQSWLPSAHSLFASFLPQSYQPSSPQKYMTQFAEWAFPDFYGPTFSNPFNEFVSGHFRNLSTGTQALLAQSSQTQGVIKIRLNEIEEFWLEFNLNSPSSIIPEHRLTKLEETLLDLSINNEITTKNIDKIFKELRDLKIVGRSKVIEGSQIFNLNMPVISEFS